LAGRDENPATNSGNISAIRRSHRSAHFRTFFSTIPVAEEPKSVRFNDLGSSEKNAQR